MDEIKPEKKQKLRRRGKTKSICRETGDHVHYPPTRLTRSTLPHHAPSPILFTGVESSFRVTRKPHYGECRKNQAADIGTTAYDGCGEFVSATTGEEDSLNCAACGCHRSFHREESLSDERCNGSVTTETTVLEVLKLSSYQFRQIFCSPYGDGNELSGEERIDKDRSGEEDLAERAKRLRTKFTAEQTEKMRDYAEKVRWKVSGENREEVDEFCIKIGVNRKRFMVWMNNHKDKN